MSEINVPCGDLRLNYLQHREEIDNAIQDVLQGGCFVLGNALKKFETAFANFCSVPYAIGVGSGTEALHLSLLACDLRPGDEVITVANTCVPTIAAISFAGGIPVLIDIDRKTKTMDPHRIEERISDRTKVILPVHLYGQCADMNAINAIAKKYGLRVVEDCAQAHGSKINGCMAGSMGDAGCYSFYPSKNLGAYGDAGMVVCRDETLACRIRELRNYGQSQRYLHESKGFNSRLDDIQAAILLAKLPYLESENNHRREIANTYNEAFRELDWMITPLETLDRYHVFHLYVACVPERKSFQEHLLKHKVSTLIHYPIPIHRQPAYNECLCQAKFLPITDDQATKLVSLPIYPELTDEQVACVIAAVRSWKCKGKSDD
jgi:dTDP-4-amino-4,6-dideoxygalactose transaminase